MSSFRIATFHGGLVIALASGACGGAEPRNSAGVLQHEIDTVSGSPTVRSSGEPPQWTLNPILDLGSIGGMGEAAPDEFGRIVSLTPDAEGRLWIADGMNQEIKAFDRDGSLALRVGRAGQGPGEFGSLYSIAWVGERLLALDFGNGRVAVLSSEGEWLGTRPAPGGITGSSSFLRLYPLGDSTAYQFSLRAADGRRVWVEHGVDGITGEWEQYSMDPPAPPMVRCDRPDGAISFFDVPFGGQVLQQPAGSGNVYVAWSADYRLALVSPAGDTLRVVERARERAPIGDDEWDEATAEFADFREEWPGADCDPPTLDRPERKAAMRRFLVDRTGRLWVEVYTATGTEWEIFDAAGRLQGALDGFDYDERVAIAIGDTLLAWVDQDSLDIQRAHLARIRSEPPP